jgi:hypothetical protein
MPRCFPSLAVVGLGVVLLLNACTPDRPVTPGLLIGPGGAILKANPENIRTVRCHQLAREAEGLLGSGWQVSVSIAELPYSFESDQYTWKSMTLAAIVSGPAEGEPETPLRQVANALRSRAGRWTDDRRAPVLTVDLQRRAAASPAPSASTPISARP